MKKIIKLTALIGALLVTLGLTACSSGSKTTEKQTEDPKSLTVQFVPSRQADTMEARAKPLADLLSEKLGIPVKVSVSTDYTSMVEAMASKKIDVGFLPPDGYVKAHDRGAADVLLQALRYGVKQPNGQSTTDLVDGYRSMIVAKSDGGIKSYEDLKGKKIAVQNVTSTSGYMMPVADLKEKGFDVEKDAQLVTVKGHDQGIISVLNGDTDAAFVFEDARTLLQKDNPNIMSEITPIYFTEMIPNDTISVRSDMSDSFRQKLSDAFIDIAKTEKGHEIVASIYSHQGYEKADDSKFDLIRKYEKLIND